MEEKGEIGIASIHAALTRPTPTDALSWRDVSHILVHAEKALFHGIRLEALTHGMRISRLNNNLPSFDETHS